MKIINTLKALPYALAVAMPASLAAESLGVAVPSAVDSAHLFGAFVALLTLLTLSADYRAPKPLPGLSSRPARTVLPLAA